MNKSVKNPFFKKENLNKTARQFFFADFKQEIEKETKPGMWKDHWVIQLITL
jgi:hypothetical protein